MRLLFLALLAALSSVSVIAQNFITVPFSNGFVGRNTANNASDSCYYLYDLGWKDIQFAQYSTAGIFVAQGNDIIGMVIITDKNNVRHVINGFIKWRTPSGNNPNTVVFQPAAGTNVTLATQSPYPSTSYNITDTKYIGLTFNGTTITITGGNGGTISGNAATSGLLDLLNAYLGTFPKISVTNADTTFYESDLTAVVRVRLSTTSSNTIKVKYRTDDGTALAVSDYTAKTDSLTFAPGDTSKLVTINLNNDGVPESSERFVLRLFQPTNASILKDSASVRILDPLSATIVSQTSANCSGTLGSATVSGVGGLSPYTYTWSPSGGTAATASNLAAGNYVCTITDAKGKTTTQNVTITGLVAPTIISVTPANRCGSGTVTLGASASAGTINWYAASTGGTSLGTGTSFSTPSISSTTTYYVDATDNGCTTASRTLVVATVNPNITASVSVSASSTSVCGSSAITFTATPTNGGSAPTYQWKLNGTDVGTGGTTYVLNTPAANDSVYVIMTSNATPCLIASVVNSNGTKLTSSTVTASVAISSNPGSTICNGTSVTFTATPINGGSSPSYQWYLNSSPVGTNIASYTNASLANGDQVYVVMTSNASCLSNSTANSSTTTITVNAIPSISSATDNNRCGTGTVTLGAAASAGTINWYAASTGGTSLGSGTSFTTPSISSTTAYYVDATANGCTTANRTAVVATVNAIPTMSGTTPSAVCGSGTVTLGAAASAGTINWYAASTGGTSLASGTSFTTPSISSTTTYYVDAIANGCTTASRTAVVATVNAIPTISGTTPGSVCGSGTVTLGASASAGTINWYAASTGGTSLGTGTSFTTPSISSTTAYYVDATANGCTTASRTAVVATVNVIPTISATTPSSVCGSGTVTLGASASAGTINWYAASTGGTSLSTGTSYTTPSISTTTTYYVDATSNGCTTASRTAVVATVNAIPTVSGITPAARCGTGTVTLGAAASAGTVNWYAASTGGTSLGTGTSFTTPSISSTTTYYVDATANSCTTTSRTAVIATVNAIPSISGTTPSSVCGSGTVTLGAAASAGTINWYAASTGGTSLSTGTSYTTPSISSTTTYYADATANGCTTASRTAVIATVNPIITASVSISASTTSVCGSNPITFTATPINGGTTPTYQWKLNGVNVGTNSSTYVLSLPVANDSVNVVMTSNATPCLATASVNGNGLKLTNATISPSVSISANPGNTVCAGTNVTFTATPINGGSSPVYQWKNKGVNIGTNSNSYSSAGLTTNDSIYVILTSNATCLSTTTANSNALVMTVNAIPSISSTTDNNRCGTGTVTLGAAASAGTINWYAASTGGTSLATGTSYTTPSISATTTYYVDVTANGCTTATRSAVIATINAIPSISSTTDNNRCGTGTVTLGATASAGTINWYAASTGGTSLGTGTSFTTPSISSTTTYYVDATANSCTTTSRTAVIATVNTIPSISSTTDNNRCGTGTVTLGATASAGTINWYAASTGGTSLATGTSYTTPSISATTTYYVDATANGCSTLTRSAVIATVNAIPSISGTTDNNRCGTGTVTLGAAASSGTINWYAASTGGTSLGSGTSFTTPSISSTTTYYVDATANGCTTASRTAVVATVNVIPTISGTTPGSVCGSGTVTLGAAASSGTINWYATSTGGTSLGSGTSFTTSSISSTTTYYVDATANGCTTATRSAVIATINAIPSISLTTDNNRCGSGTVILGAAASAGTINWYAASTGGTSLGTGTTFTTPSISSTTTYYVDATANGCTTASRTAVVATVNAIPSISGTTPSSVCGSGTVTLGAAASAGTINWYASSTGGTNLGSGTSFTTPSITTTTTYYVDATANGCTTASRTAVVATVNAVPTISGTTPGSVCGSGTVTLGASASAGTINWYAASTGGTSLSTGTSYTTPSISTTTTYYVDATANGCTTASRTAVVATVNAIPTISGTTPSSVCGSGTVTLGAAASAGTINWYAASTGGTSLATGTSYTTPSISSTTTYYADATANGCTTASRTAVVATVNAIPTISGTTPAARCSTGTVTLGATASAGTVNWYSAASGGTSLGTGATFTTPSISGTTTYYVDATNIGCTTVNRTAVIATVNPNITASVSVSASTTSVCGSNPITFTATPTNGGTAPTYQWKLNGVNVGTNAATYILNTPLANDSVNVVMTSNATPCLVNTQSTGNGVKLTNSTVNPVVTITSNTGNTICAGGNIVFTATPNNGGSSPTYQWYRNGVNVGTNSATFSTTTLNNNDTIKVLLTSNASCLSTSTAMSNALVITVNTTPSITTQPVLQRIISGNTVQFSVLANNVVSYQWQTAPQTGAFINVPNGSVYTGGNTATLFVSNTNGLNNQRYRVVLTNVCGNTNSDSVTLFINAKPDALNDTLFVAQGKQDSVVVLNNDSDADGILSNPTIVSAPLHGTSTATLSGKITYQPTAGYYGYDTLSYRVCDNGNPVACDTAFVFIKINAAPIVSNDTISINEDDSVIINVRLNDNDPDGPLNNPVIRTQPNNGTVTINPNGTITFKPNPNFHGLDSFMYRVCDNGMPVLCDSAWVRLNILDVNDGPDALDDTLTFNEDDSITVDLRLNDNDVDGTLNNPVIIANPANGSVVVNADGTIKYIPNPNCHGLDSFMYRVCDNGMPVLCDSAWVRLNINPINDAPNAVNDSVHTSEHLPIVINVRNNDTDVDGVLNNPVALTQPANGTLTINANGTITFTPVPFYHGIDSFMYRVCDNGLPILCDSAWVIIRIDSLNDAPDAVDDSLTVSEDDSITVDLRLNDTDVDGTLNNPVIITNPANGSVLVNADGTVKYIPNPNYHGLDSFMYRVCDDGTPALCDSAWVRLNILDVNDGPDAIDDILTVSEDDSVTVDLRLNDTDLDGTLNNPTIITNPAHGSVVVNADGTVKYIPNPNYHGLDSFMYRVCDNGMPVLCDSALVRINVLDVNDKPAAINDTASTNQNVAIVISVLTNDIDTDGTLNNPTVVTQPLNGTVVVNANGTLAYTPNTNYFGVDSFMYKVCDNGTPVLCDSAWVNITIKNVISNLAPIAVDDTIQVNEKDKVVFNVTTNDYDQDGNKLGLPVVIKAPLHGTLLLRADTTFIYIPATGYIGNDQFTYTIADNGIPSKLDTAVVYIDVVALVVKVPDGFSPDGDGTNDKFVIPGIEKYPNNKLTIVNRWGDVVYEKSQYQNDWGGEPNKGILLDKGVLPAGNYFYIFETGTTDKSITGSLYINK